MFSCWYYSCDDYPLSSSFAQPHQRKHWEKTLGRLLPYGIQSELKLVPQITWFGYSWENSWGDSAKSVYLLVISKG
jgi:hypothetical protein